MDDAARQVEGYGAAARPLRHLLALLTERPYRLDELIRESALPRRTVEELLAALGTDLVEEPDGRRIRPDRIDAYRQRFGYHQLRRTTPADPLAGRVAEAGALLAAAGDLIARAPRAATALDHVSATPETAVRRALWLDSRYDLAGAHLLCLGDHDLTSLLVAQVNPEVTVTVVDLDERILAYLDEAADARGLALRCLVGDLRFGLPASARDWADLVFTDPPYTPEGVRLFLAQGLRGLRDREHGRLVMAYGYSDRHPALGWQVQQAAARLGLAFEAILPGFNRYLGAQAVGSASDLYVCRPTARSWKSAGEPVPAGGIYTHGPQSGEATAARADDAAVRELLDLAGPAAVLVSPWGGGETRVRLDTVVNGGLPPHLGRDPGIAVDLSADPGAWLLRTLLAANAGRLAMRVPPDHPDVATRRAREALADLLAPKYRLTFRDAVVLADRVEAAPDPVARLRRHVLDRAHGRLGNVWRDGLVRLDGLTRAQARQRVAAAARRPDSLDAALVELPRHRLAEVLRELAATPD
jgi:hypothetical protein